MFIGSQLGMIAGRVNAVVTFVASYVDASNLTTYTYSAVDLGPSRAKKVIIVPSCGIGGTVPAVSTLTVDGVSASFVGAQSNGFGETRSEIWQVELTANPSGTVVVTYASGATRAGIGVYWASDSASAASHVQTSNANPTTVSINVPAGGYCVAVSSNNNDDVTAWTGITERFDDLLEVTTRQSGASDNFAAAQTGLTVAAAPGNALARNLVAAAWGPA